MISPWVDYYCYYNCKSGHWVEVDPEVNTLTTNEMLQRLDVGEKAYVVNHRGYRAFVIKLDKDDYQWRFPVTNYKSDFAESEEDCEKLLWIIQ